MSETAALAEERFISKVMRAPPPRTVSVTMTPGSFAQSERVNSRASASASTTATVQPSAEETVSRAPLSRHSYSSVNSGCGARR
ncbi:MAG: hypothetical protein ACLUFV_00585 [Acutalibacteraceae bacterium]